MPPGDDPPAPVVLTGTDLTVAEVEAVARLGRGAVLDPDARARIREARGVIERLVGSAVLADLVR